MFSIPIRSSALASSSSVFDWVELFELGDQSVFLRRGGDNGGEGESRIERFASVPLTGVNSLLRLKLRKSDILERGLDSFDGLSNSAREVVEPCIDRFDCWAGDLRGLPLLVKH